MPLGFYLDSDKCIGCHTCEVACKEKNDLEPGLHYRCVDSYETGVFPAASVFHISKSCNFCANPACFSACPMGAIQINEEGLTIYDSCRCIACKSCAAACPFDVPQFSSLSRIMRKCDSCLSLRQQDYNPACVDACHMRCLFFGEINELKKEFDLNESETNIFQARLHEFETSPSTNIQQTKSYAEPIRQVTL